MIGHMRGLKLSKLKSGRKTQGVRQLTFPEKGESVSGFAEETTGK